MGCYFSVSFNVSYWYGNESQIAVGVRVTWFDISGEGSPELVDKTYSDMVIIDLPYLVTGTSNLEDVVASKLELTAYPNPTSGDVVVEGLRLDVDDGIFVYDLLGNLVLKTRSNKLERVSISLNHLPAGIYLLRTSTGIVKITKTG